MHPWYHRTFGGDPVPPLTSAADGVATWPERAISVAVRLAGDDRLEVCAPVGVDDLLDGIWRRNPRRVSRAQSRARLARHNPAVRRLAVRVIAP